MFVDIARNKRRGRRAETSERACIVANTLYDQQRAEIAGLWEKNSRPAALVVVTAPIHTAEKDYRLARETLGRVCM